MRCHRNAECLSVPELMNRGEKYIFERNTSPFDIALHLTILYHFRSSPKQFLSLKIRKEFEKPLEMPADKNTE